MTRILLLNDKEGYLEQSSIRKEYRGLGLSLLFYKIRMAWASKLKLKQLKVSRRESHTHFQSSQPTRCIRYSYRESVNWLDAITEDVPYYVPELQ